MSRQLAKLKVRIPEVIRSESSGNNMNPIRCVCSREAQREITIRGWQQRFAEVSDQRPSRVALVGDIDSEGGREGYSSGSDVARPQR